MNQANWQKIEKLFNAALEIPTEKRTAFLDSTCPDDEIRNEVESLLANAETEDSFLGKPNLSLGLAVLSKEKNGLLIGEKIGRYRIIRLLGEGGMGAVYLAEDLPLNRQVALKLLPVYLVEETESVARFRKEALAASAISHPNIAHIYEAGIEINNRFIAMEFVEGKTLRDLLKEKKLDIVTCLDILWQTANALAAAHQAGIVHRDIKPENIMIRRDGYVKVLDFGIAKLLQNTEAEPLISPAESLTENSSELYTDSGLIMGTMAYISPEQLKNKNVDLRTDIWSLGVVLYELLSGNKPFKGKTSEEIGKSILRKKPAPILLSDLNADDEVFLQNILAKMLNKDAAKRYQSANELAKDLKTLKQNLEFSRQFSTGEINGENNSTGFSNTFGKTGDVSFLTKSKQFWISQPFSRKALLMAVCIGVLTFSFGFSFQYFNRSGDNRQNAANLPKVTHLTQDGRIKDVAISADGRWLAYIPVEAGGQSLWIRDLLNGTEKQLQAPEAVRRWGIRFLPDGENLLFNIIAGNGSINSLYKISINGGQPLKIASNITNPPAVSPDGSRIAFVRPDTVKRKDLLMIANIDGSHEREIAAREFPETFSTLSASWSPDGKNIAIGAGRNRDSEYAFLTIPIEGGKATEITPWQWAATGGIAWEKDGRGLVFSAREKGSKTLRLWRISSPEGEIQSLTNEENAYEEISLSSSENTIVTTRTYEVSDIWSLDSNGILRRLTTQGNRGADGLTVIPNGQIIYTEGEYEQSFLWSMTADGGRKKLTENTGFLPAASRDGRFIGYVSTEGGTRHIWMMNADGSNNHQIVKGEGENYPNFTPDGNWLIYTSLEKERNTLWKISTAGGQPVQITKEGFAVKPQVSPDGKMIACTYRLKRDDEWKIIILPIEGGQPLKTFDFPNTRSQMIRWTPDSRALFYVNTSSGAQNLWQQPLDGTAKQITYFNEDQILHYDLLNDKFILSRGGRRRDIALIKNYK